MNQHDGEGYNLPAQETEVKKPIFFLVSYKGNISPKVEEFASTIRHGAEVIAVDCNNLPLTPPVGLNEVFIYSGGDPKFLNQKQQQAWSGIAFRYLKDEVGGNYDRVTFSSEMPDKTAKDFKVMGE